jgi:hypothetical protein
MVIPPPAGEAANNAKLVVTLILYSPSPAEKSDVQGTGASAKAENLHNRFVSGNRPGLLILPAQVVEPEIASFARQAYCIASARAKPVTQLTFCFLFDKDFPGKPTRKYAKVLRRTLQFDFKKEGLLQIRNAQP